MIIQVTQDHINSAYPMNTSKGAIALALQDAGSEERLIVSNRFMMFSHKAHGWVDKYFECSEEIQEWQHKSIYTNGVKPIKIEFDAENKVARLVK